jgi:ATP-dependent DNA ligase
MLKPPIQPMEARSAAVIPPGAAWIYEPKWDGFRCIAFKDGTAVALQSKSGQPLERYFPEIADAIRGLAVPRVVLDGELAIESGGRLDFDALLQRIHPAESRVRKLARETPATYFIFDILQEGDRELYELPLQQRREALEPFARRVLSEQRERLALSPATSDVAQAQRWYQGGMRRFDGVIAKRAEAPYRFGERDAVVKIKRAYSADCVVGGFRVAKGGKTIASLLLGLYGDDGLLHLVGFIGSLSGAERARAAQLLRPIVAEPGFTGARPGGVSRWGSRDAQWFPVKPAVVVEVGFDHVTGSRLRHGARFIRWRPDKSPQQCRMGQLQQPRSG